MEQSVLIDAPLTVRPMREYGRGLERVRMNGSYQSRQLDDANERTKQPQRERIADHLLKWHRGGPIKLMSMPGVHWPFEHYLANRTRQSLSVIGLEWNWPVIELGRPYMLGRTRPVFFDRALAIGTIKCLRTDAAVWAWTHAGDLLTMGRRDKGSKRSRGSFSRLFKGCDAAWLDINSNLSEETRKCLRGLPEFVDMRAAVIPFAVTIIAAQEGSGLRDGADAVSRRVPIMVECIEYNGRRRCKIEDAWKYQSETGQHMLNVTGVLE